MQSEVQYLFESSSKAEKAHEAPSTLEERLAPLTSYLDEHLQVTAREQSRFSRRRFGMRFRSIIQKKKDRTRCKRRLDKGLMSLPWTIVRPILTAFSASLLSDRNQLKGETGKNRKRTRF
jgi:hypothetical protein